MVVKLTDSGDVEYRSDHRHQQDRANIVEEHPVGHKVPGIEDDRRQHIEEERVRRERGHVQVGGVPQQHPDDDTHHNQQAGLGEHFAQLGRHVETCEGG